MHGASQAFKRRRHPGIVAMDIYPAIDLQGGHVVQLVGGDPDRVAVKEDRTPAEQAGYWRRLGARRFHVIDLDAALGRGDNLSQLQGILGHGEPVTFGGGVRHMMDIESLLARGIGRVIVGTQGVRNPRWLREVAAIYPGKIVLAIDARGRDIVVKGWTESADLDVVTFAKQMDDAGLAGFLYTNVDKEGRLEGVDLGVLRDLRDAIEQTPLIVSGGISSHEDLAAIATIGCDGAVLGMSIYTGAIDLARAVQDHETTPASRQPATQVGA